MLLQAPRTNTHAAGNSCVSLQVVSLQPPFFIEESEERGSADSLPENSSLCGRLFQRASRHKRHAADGYRTKSDNCFYSVSTRDKFKTIQSGKVFCVPVPDVVQMRCRFRTLQKPGTIDVRFCPVKVRQVPFMPVQCLK